MSGLKVVFASTIGVLIVLAVTSCAVGQTPIPTVSQVSGSWVHSSESGHPVVTFRLDHSVVVADVPESVVTGDLTHSGKFSANHPVTLVGTWTVGNAAGTKRDGAGEPFVQVNFSPNHLATGINLVVSGTGGSMRLLVEAGDPDDYATYTFSRKNGYSAGDNHHSVARRVV
jgi:hypothetical protein